MTAKLAPRIMLLAAIMLVAPAYTSMGPSANESTPVSVSILTIGSIAADGPECNGKCVTVTNAYECDDHHVAPEDCHYWEDFETGATHIRGTDSHTRFGSGWWWGFGGCTGIHNTCGGSFAFADVRNLFMSDRVEQFVTSIATVPGAWVEHNELRDALQILTTCPVTGRPFVAAHLQLKQETRAMWIQAASSRRIALQRFMNQQDYEARSGFELN